jgi:hypothetical protein
MLIVNTAVTASVILHAVPIASHRTVAGQSEALLIPSNAIFSTVHGSRALKESNTIRWTSARHAAGRWSKRSPMIRTRSPKIAAGRVYRAVPLFTDASDIAVADPLAGFTSNQFLWLLVTKNTSTHNPKNRAKAEEP